VRKGCWYDLSGLSEAEGLIRCPECARQSSARQRLQPGRRLRLGVIAALSLISGTAMLAVPWVRRGGWVRAVPSLALVSTEHTPICEPRGILQDEVDRRVQDGKLRVASSRLLASRLVLELNDDNVRWNAERARSHLQALWPASREALERTLVDGDEQARLIAAQLLRDMCDDPSDALLDACVADLRDDSDEVRRYLSYYTAYHAANYLIRFPDRVGPHLEPALSSGDEQQRLYAAAVAGHTQQFRLMDLAAPILIEHLRGNHVDHDAQIAAQALHRFGPPVIPFLRLHVADNDEQLAGCVRHLIERLEHPDRTRFENPLPRINSADWDPIGANKPNF
jgi:hypothetical protein